MCGAKGAALFLMKYTHVIWDFNGTILEDMQAGIDAVNTMLATRGLPLVESLAGYRELFDFPVQDYYARLGFDFEKEDFGTVLAPAWVRLYEKNCKNATLYPGVRPLNLALREGGLSQSILSASEREMMLVQLAERGADGWFDEIWGNDSIHAHGKEELALAWRAAHPTARAVLIGDTTHDAKAATLAGADCILVAAGHQSAGRLAACNVPVVPELAGCLPLILGK